MIAPKADFDFEAQWQACKAGHAFNYSDAQWQAITFAFRDGCGRTLRLDEMVLLLDAANDYLKDLPHHQPAAKRAEMLLRRAKTATDFRRMLVEAENDLGWGSIEQEERSKLLKLVDRFIQTQEVNAELINLGAHGPTHPRAVFFECIMGSWVSAGGRLRRSRDIDGRVGGPLVRYIQAVTSPVMGKAAPKPETIFKFIFSARESRRLLGDVVGRDGSVSWPGSPTAEHKAWQTAVIARAGGACQWPGCGWRDERQMFTAIRAGELQDDLDPSNGICLCGLHFSLVLWRYRKMLRKHARRRPKG
jgi:hypothetical protein